MSNILLSFGAVVGQPGAVASFPAGNIRTFQINTRAGVAFTGTVDIETSSTNSPGGNSYQVLTTINFSNHVGNFSLDIESAAPFVRAILSESTSGVVAVYGTSRSGSVSGSTGTSQNQSTAVVTGPSKTGVVGSGVHIVSPIVPQFTSDDVVYSKDISLLVTDVLESYLDLAKTLDDTNTDPDDLAVLGGVSSAVPALTNQKMLDLAQYQPSISEINFSVGVTSGIQAQLDTLTSDKAIGAGVDITGLAVDASWMNSFFDVDPAGVSITVSGLSTSLGGLSSSAADLNVLIGVGSPTSPNVAPVAADFWKLADITASADEINSLNGFTGDASDLNKFASVTSSAADLNAIDGLSATSVTSVELGHLSGLTENVQLALTNIPDLSGLNATPADLNILHGAATGTLGYTGAITVAELTTLDGINAGGNIQAQLDSKRNIADSIGVGELTDVDATTIEINYLVGSTSNIQLQIDALGDGAPFLSRDGISGIDGVIAGTLTGPIYLSNGGPASPSTGFAGGNTSGLYLEGVGIGISTAGLRVGSFDASNFTLGDGVSGLPSIRFASPDVVNPAYSFVGNDTTGVTLTDVNAIGLIAGSKKMVEARFVENEVRLGGDENNTDNIAVTVHGIAGFEKVLGVADVDGLTPGQTLIYKVPANRTAIITKLMVIIVSSDADTAGMLLFRMDVGTLPTYTNLVDNDNHGIFDGSIGYDFITAGQVMPLGTGANSFDAIAANDGGAYGIYSAAEEVFASVTAAPGAANDYSLQLVAIGYEYGV